MDAFEKNKIAGAILSALLLIVSINVFTNAFFEKSTARVVGYDLPAEGEAATPGKESAAAEPAIPLPVMLAKADPTRGEKALGKCKACHSFEKGGPNRVGPNLYNIINHTMGAAVGFNYSSAFKAKNGEKAVWTFEAMDHYLTNPKAYIKGTNMAFAGISKAEERADIIAYLRTLSDSPIPLPAAPAPSAAAPPPAAEKTPPPTTPAPATATPSKTPASPATLPPAAAAPTPKTPPPTTPAPATTTPSTTPPLPATLPPPGPAPTPKTPPPTTPAPTTTPSTTPAPSAIPPPAAAAGSSSPFLTLLAKADPAKGELATAKCKACHTFEKGGPNRIGPNLYGVVNRPVGSVAGFNYSAAFKQKNVEKAVWTAETLDAYLANPKGDIKGANMTFAGIPKAEERADVIAYLKTLSDNPVPPAP